MLVHRHVTLALLVGALLAACGAFNPPDPRPPVPRPIATCPGACETLRRLGCEAGEDTPAGSTCEEVCENLRSSGIVSWDLRCMASAESCEETEECD